ncbi:ROK family protein [Maribellus sediminis]|uniref:ROK family protein n=1 Tax=Maribellus sediminis TaxID=2696285 RepID=UPI00142F54E5|nr:ROK family protein [Maribellus sediminis]
MENQALLIGIDGGATKVSAWEIVYDKQQSTFVLGAANAVKSYREIEGFIPDFKPVELTVQLNERTAEIHPTSEEKQQAAVYVEACAQAIHALAQQTGKAEVLIGIGMPGLKTDSKRGIAVVANGPRMVDYADRLEQRLLELGIQLAAPIAHLGSDADYCGIGENYAQEGLFRSVSNAYYLGGGTGVADAMKLDGKLVTFDNAKEWMAKTWEMKSAEGISLELVTSVSGIQRTYAGFAGKTLEELNEAEIYPLQISGLAKSGEEAAIRTFEVVNQNLARLLYERIVTLNQGWKDLFGFVNPNRPALNPEHPNEGKVFEVLIIGQRLGDLFDDENGKEIVRKPVLAQLHELIQNSEFLPAEIKKHYKDIDAVVQVSKLREAPALGAGVDAFLAR